MLNSYLNNEFSYYNPVKIKFGFDALTVIKQLSFLNKKRVLIITSKGWSDRPFFSELRSQFQECIVYNDVPPNPDFKSIENCYNSVWSSDFQPDVIISLGGGSVMDFSKAICLYDNNKDFNTIRNLIKDKHYPCNVNNIPIVAIPTTSGTSSEITPWATIWDFDEKKKYSLHHELCWVHTAIYDPKLTITKPKDLTLITGLDALSHSFESIWNKNQNEISTEYAVQASKLIIKTLPSLLNDLSNLDLRTSMMKASMLSGLAFSNTQTAIAHAISYYLTANKNIPHGIACSFSLPIIIDALLQKDLHSEFPKIHHAFSEIFGSLTSKHLYDFFNILSISNDINQFELNDIEFLELKNSVVSNQRAQNSIIEFHEIF